MLRISLILAGFLFSMSTWADAISECKSAAKNSVDSCTKWAGDTASQQNSSANSIASACAGHPNIPGCAGGSSDLGAANQIGLDNAKKVCDKHADTCSQKCDPSKAQKPNEKQFLTQQRDDCKKKIDAVKSQLDAGKPGNQDAKDGGQKQANASDGKQASNNQTPMPPMSIPPPPPPADNKTPDPDKPADTPAAPAAAAPATPPPPTQVADSGKVGFQSASTKAAAATACPGRNTTEIQGCTESSSMQVASLTPTPFSQAAAGGGAAPSGGGGGGLNAASVASALAAGVKLGESEKDGKNSGLKASSLNLATDGGGGGGGGSSGMGAGLDYDFMKPNLRNPASLAVAKKTDLAVPGHPSVAQEKYSVVRIVTDVYTDKCKASLFLHCGKNK